MGKGDKKEKYEVVIIGAGPAGLSAAEVLARAGKKTLILEKSKIIGQKVCVGALSAKNKLIGLPTERLGNRLFCSVKYHFQGKTRIVSSKNPIIVTTERTKLGEFLLQLAQKAGAEVKLGISVDSIKENFVIVNGKSIYFDYLIGADGSSSLIRKFLKIPIKKNLLSLIYEIKQYYNNLEIFLGDQKLFNYGYGSIFPHKNYTQFTMTFDAKMKDIRFVKNKLDNWLKQEGVDVAEGLFKAGVINYDYRGFQFGNKFLVGDAGGFASGLTGEGIYQAIISGQEVARKIINPKYKCPGISHILALKFFHEKILKKLLKTKTLLLSRIVYEILVILSNLPLYNFLFRLKPFPRQT